MRARARVCHTSRVRTLLLLALGLGSLGAACGGDDGTSGSDPSETKLLQHFGWSLADASAAGEATQAVRALEPSPELEGWTVVAQDHWLSPAVAGDPDSRLTLGLRGGAQRRIAIQGPFEPAAFNRVRAVTRFGSGARPSTLEVVCVREGEAVRRATSLMPATSQDQVHLLDLPAADPSEPPYDELVVHFQSASPTLTLRALDLLAVTAADHYPRAGGPEGYVTLGRDTRPAVGLTREQTLVFEAQSTAPQSQLRFALGARPDLVRAGQTAELQLRTFHGSELLATDSLQLEPVPRDVWTRWTHTTPESPTGPLRFELSFAPGLEVDMALAITPPRIVQRSEDPPTVLLVTSDTHRADHLGVAGDAVDIRTPTLDALAQRGTLFEDCWTAANVTIPSHVALMTARTPRDTGVFDNLSRLGPDAPTLARAFRDAGYLTVASTSVLHLRHDTCGLAQGFDRLVAPAGEQWRAENAIEHLEQWVALTRDEPLFVWLHLFDAHTPYEPPGEFNRYYYPEGQDPRDPALAEPPTDFGQIDSGMRGVRDVEFPRAQYRAEISYLDQQLARILEQPRFEQAWIALTSDHGESLGNHGIWFRHAGLYPDTLHVPLLLAGPGVEASTRRSDPVRQIDIGRTLLDLAGERDADFGGRNLLEADAASRAPRFAISSHALSASIQSEGWFFVLHLQTHALGGAQRFRHAGELYHLSSDPACANDVVRDDLERARRMRDALVRWLTSASPDALGGQAAADPALRAHLEALGYGGSEAAVDPTALFDPDCDCVACRVFEE